MSGFLPLLYFRIISEEIVAFDVCGFVVVVPVLY